MGVNKKYSFSQTPKLYMINDNMQDSRKRDVVSFLAELKDFKLNLKSLASSCPSLKIRNKLLNIVFLILEDSRLTAFIHDKKSIPLKKISQLSGELPDFISKYRNYIILYFILLYPTKHTSLRNFLTITEDTNIPYDNSQNTLMGVVLAVCKNSSIILTSTGAIINIVPTNIEHSDVKLGDIIEGVKMKAFNGKLPLIIGMSFILALSIFIASLVYNNTQSVVVLEISGNLTLRVNSFGKVHEVSGGSSTTRKIVKNLKIDNKSLDKALYDILAYSKDTGIIDKGSSINIYITNKSINLSKLEDTVNFLKGNQINTNINNNGKDEFIDSSSNDISSSLLNIKGRELFIFSSFIFFSIAHLI
ncbi:MAG: hypothetical protein MR639_14790 [Clostridium sp.]|uniref:anti-sigma-I factor RsgI family protein n=1 Tax=Clostridium sp. TaxID=1506 RepID=UPI002A8C29DA|nr:hypothetical protein [Clostridium sp.]MDY5098572.1 hypothetical protein [Clostridium sp.]